MWNVFLSVFTVIILYKYKQGLTLIRNKSKNITWKKVELSQIISTALVEIVTLGELLSSKLVVYYV